MRHELCDFAKKNIYIKEIEKFKEHLKIKNYAESTITTSIVVINNFLKFTSKKQIKDIASKDIEKYLSDKRSKIRITTIAKNIVWLRIFFRWLKKNGYILIDPMDNIENPRLGYTLPLDVLTENQVLKIINAPDTRTLKGKRDKAILEIMYSTGIRLKELCNLKTNDLDLVNGYLRVNQGKGSKDRVVPLGKKASDAIKTYLTEVKYSIEYAFLSTGRKEIGNLAYVTIMNIIKGYGEKLNIKVTPHTLRRTFATHMIKRGADVMSVKAMLGHEKITTIERYVKLVIRDLKKEHAKCHPCDK